MRVSFLWMCDPLTPVWQIFGVDKRTGNEIKFDPSKTIAENGITPTSHPTLRFPSKFA